MKKQAITLLLCFGILLASVFPVTVGARPIIDEESLPLPKLQTISLAKQGSKTPAETHDISHGSATWSWGQGKDIHGIAIDAVAPWARQNLETVPAGKCQLAWTVTPDKVRVTVYDLSDPDSAGTSPAETQEVDHPYVLDLKAGRLYIVDATWNESHLQTDGGCGEVEYSFRTE